MILRVQVIRAKYGCGTDMNPKFVQKKDATSLWRGLCDAWEHVDRNISWRMRNGSMIRFCLDNWVPLEGPLIRYIDNVDQNVDVNCTISHFILPAGQWDCQKLSSCLPASV